MKLLTPLVALLVFAPPALGYDLPGDLRQRVDRLVAAVQAEPTTLATADERVAVLWEWANAISLQGAVVPKNLPYVGLYVPYPIPGTEPNPNHLEAIDTYVRHLSFLEEDPRALGAVSVGVGGAVPARSWQTVRVEWRVGSLGVAEGGGVLASQHYGGGYGQLQVDDPAGDNYVSATTSNSSVRLELDQAPVWGPYGGFRSAQGYPVFRVRGASLSPGDTVTVVYGDRAGGGRGLEIGVFSNDAIALPLHVDPGDGTFYELPLPTYAVVGTDAYGVHGFAPSIVAAGEEVSISVRTEDRFYNRATGEIPSYGVFRGEQKFAQTPAGRALYELPLRFTQPGVVRITFRSDDGEIRGVANPIWVRESPTEHVYWGETHGHCGFAEGQGTPEGYFRFARDDARLDFVTLTEHDLWLTDANWKYLNDAAKQFHRENELLVFPGYEWTVARQRGGHHNVFFRGPGFDRVPVQEAPDLSMLYRGLRQKHDPKDVLIIPHAHQNGDFRLSDLDMETLIEIMSGHGTFEWFGQRYLQSGFRVGFVGASDDHRGHPGYSPGHPTTAGVRSNIFQFGGLAAAWAPSKTTDDVFDALKARRAYATTGAQRIILDARLNGGAMGSALPLSETRRVEGRAIGTGPIRSIQLIKNGEVDGSFDTSGAASGEASANEVTVRFYSESYVTIRDNPRGQRTWTGNLSVENGRLTGARFLGTPHLDADRLEVEEATVGFHFATRGSRRAIALTIEGTSASTRVAFDLEAAREMGTAPTQVRTPQEFAEARFALVVPELGQPQSEEVLEEGRYRDRVSVERAVGLRDDVEFSFTDRGGDPGDWYYVRVEQLDGHLAWSSPWWVGGEPPR